MPHVSAGLLVMLPPRPSSAGIARELVGRQLQDWQVEDLCEDAALVITELVVNAVKHAQTDLELRIVHLHDGVRIEVRDGSAALPQRRAAGSAEENGRGLQIVEALAANFGVDVDDVGKRVWVELKTV